MKLPAAALLAIVSSSIPAFAVDAHAALAVARQAVEKADYRASGHLVRVDASGSRTSYPISFKAHWFPGTLRVMVEVAPPSGSGANHPHALHVLLEMRPGGQNSIRVAQPGDTAPSLLPVDKWTDGMAGAGFSFEDFFEEQLFWSSQAVTEHVKYGARDCDLIKSTPGPTDKTHYADVSTWLDRGSSFPVHEEKTVKGSGVVKEYTYYGLRHEGGVWSADQIEEKNHGQGGSTLLIIDRGSTKANLGPADFNTDRLIHF